VIAAAGGDQRQYRLGDQIAFERQAVEIRQRQCGQRHRLAEPIRDDLRAPPVDEIRHARQVPAALQGAYQRRQRCLSLKHDGAVHQVKERGRSRKLLPQHSHVRATDGDMPGVTVRAQQVSDRQPGHHLVHRRDRDAHQVGALRQESWQDLLLQHGVEHVRPRVAR